ncbi:spore coat protein [Paenibacillus xanthanilyticus]|uniref:Spore coat protein n=1 Tax=Paenibacillus xanthanilyticus TaxID=1783531 RepID=A0ABV8K740_9BACL
MTSQSQAQQQYGTAQYGAHEILEIHEVLAASIDAINLFQVYRPFVQDPQLARILDNQLQFMTQGYQTFVQLINGQGAAQPAQFRAPKNVQPLLGLRQPTPAAPNQPGEQLDDRDVACAALNCHKNGAVKKMLAALECTNPQFRAYLQQSAVNCSEQAYELWQYMNQKGFYQVPTLQDNTTQTMIQTYAPAPQGAFATR